MVNGSGRDGQGVILPANKSSRAAMISRRVAGLSRVILASIIACHRTIPAPMAAIPAGETACWWTLLRTALPPDSVAARFKGAFATLGLHDVNQSKNGDTIRVAAFPIPTDSGSFGSRAVAFPQADSTNFRFYVMPSSISRRSKSSAAKAGPSSDELESCANIARAAAIHWSTPGRSPNAEDSLTVWREAERSGTGGITFRIESTRDRGPAAGVFNAFSGLVTVARDRGRLDVVARSASTSIRISGTIVDAPRGSPGDYYLFDSTGFALVRPAQKTFSVSSISENSFNYQERRDGWPKAFEFTTPRVDTLPPDSSGSVAVTYHRLPIFWHLDLEQPVGIRVLARGRMTLEDVPLGEATVARWFGAASALAHIPDGVASLADDQLRVTTVVVVAEGAGRSPPINLVVLHALSTVRSVRMDPNRLAVPSDYVEIPWQFTVAAVGTNLTSVSRAQSAHWKSIP
jgi:hypothetical protein